MRVPSSYPSSRGGQHARREMCIYREGEKMNIGKEEERETYQVKERDKKTKGVERREVTLNWESITEA